MAAAGGENETNSNEITQLEHSITGRGGDGLTLSLAII